MIGKLKVREDPHIFCWWEAVDFCWFYQFLFLCLSFSVCVSVPFPPESLSVLLFSLVSVKWKRYFTLSWILLVFVLNFSRVVFVCPVGFAAAFLLCNYRHCIISLSLTSSMPTALASSLSRERAVSTFGSQEYCRSSGSGVSLQGHAQNVCCHHKWGLYGNSVVVLYSFLISIRGHTP